MGVTNSKAEKTEALRLCKERKRYIKQAIDSRYAFAAAHVAYIDSLRNVGVALRRFAEAEVLIESSLSTSATEVDKTPSHSSYPSPSPSHIGGVPDSPAQNGSPRSPQPSVTTRLSYMRSGGVGSVTVRVNPSRHAFVDDIESIGLAMPPPPPPIPGSGSSWDYFDPNDDNESFSFMGQNEPHLNFDDVKLHRQASDAELDLDGINGTDEGTITLKSDQKGYRTPGEFTPQSDGRARIVVHSSSSANSQKPECSIQQTVSIKASAEKAASEKAILKKEKDICPESEDPSEFITHRAKDFLSSIKDIEHRFFRAFESGKEVSRMLEANKIRVGYSEAKGRSPSTPSCLTNLQPDCCLGKTSFVSHDHQQVTKVITWKRSASSRSSSSRNPLATGSKDDNDGSESDFVEEFCMIAGSHSSTLDRLFAWERKLYDEVKASELVRKDYERKCNHLRHQFAKDLSAHLIDKTRTVVKDLHSQLWVALHAVDSISKRIEKMRDDELLPQLLELIQGMIRMWKAMLECHHAQYITISLAYHAKTSMGIHLSETGKQIMLQLKNEIECFGVSFADWINSHTSYVEALNNWLQNCILQPRDRKGRKAFSPRRLVAPPIFILSRDWSAGIKSLPSVELSDAIKGFLYDLQRNIRHHAGEVAQPKEGELDQSNNDETGSKHEVKNDNDNDSNDHAKSSYLSAMHASLTKVLDRLTKFSEEALKMYEDIRQKTETARYTYSIYRPPRSFSI